MPTKTFVCHYGYGIVKKKYTFKDINRTKKDLNVKPFSAFQISKFSNQSTSYPVYLESKTKIYMPKFYGLEHFGEPDQNMLDSGYTIDLSFSGSLRDSQEAPVDAFLSSCKKGPLTKQSNGGIISLPCGGGKTIVGNDCLFMISSHIAHDCKVGNNVIIANNVPLGGHVVIEDSVVIGGNSAVQQFTRIGRLAMIGGMTGVLKDVIPFGLSIGNRNYLQGLNLIGLRRKNYENKKIMELNKAYDEIFSSNNLHENLNKINGEFKNNELIEEVVNFIAKDKKRAICTPINKQ